MIRNGRFYRIGLVLVLLMVFAVPQDGIAQRISVPLPGQTSLAAIPPAWRVYAPSACRPSARCVVAKRTEPGSTSSDYETSDYETSNTAIGLAVLGYAIGGTIGGFVTHAVAPTPEDRYEGFPVRELFVGSVVGAVSAGTVLHVVDGGEGHYGYTIGGAVVGNLAMAGLGALFVHLARSRRSEGLGWFSVYAFIATPLASIAVADEVNQRTAR